MSKTSSPLSVIAGALAAIDCVLSLSMGLLVMWATKNEQPVFTFLFFGLSLVIGVGGFRWLALRKHRFALIWGIVWLLLLLSLAVLGVLIGTSPMGVV